MYTEIQVAIGFAAVLVLAALLKLVSMCYRKVGPNKVLIVSGRHDTYLNPYTGERVRKAFKIFHGGGTFVIPLRERVDTMSVELMTLEILTPEFFTKFGVPIVVDGIAQIKVRSEDPVAVATAAEMFLSKSTAEMNEIAHQMMQGHLRAVISTMPFEEIHANPEAFAQTVQKLTAEDLANMGIQVVSFTIREIQDPSGYLKALGRPKLAEVQKDAAVGEANAERDAAIGRAHASREAAVTSAHARQESDLAKLTAEVKVLDAQAERDKRFAEVSCEVAEKKAESDLAYELSTTKTKQLMLREQLLVRDLEIQSRERELSETVQKPAEAERLRIETMAQAERARIRIVTEAQAEATRLMGQAEADAMLAHAHAEVELVRKRALAEAEGLRCRLEAEAEGMQKKAEAWKNYGSAAVAELVISKLPEIASAVAAPLAKVDRIVLIGDGGGGGSAGIERVTRSVGQVLAQVPSMVEAMSGIDLIGLMKRIGSDGASEPKAAIEASTQPIVEAPAKGEQRCGPHDGSVRRALSPEKLRPDPARTACAPGRPNRPSRCVRV
ncbi:MAG TPA: SPFH domain-containing protein [Polyangiaceae bacterium]|nr:SPFH domain-containing protein [Polyangiaceae bacterium]